MLYEVTLTLRPRLYKLSPEEQHLLVSGILDQLLVPYECSMICELTKENNVHYHGLVELRDLVHRNRFLNHFRKFNTIFGKKTCEQVMYYQSYVDYMKKDIKNTEQIIHYPIVKDHYGIFSVRFVPLEEGPGPKK